MRTSRVVVGGLVLMALAVLAGACRSHGTTRLAVLIDVDPVFAGQIPANGPGCAVGVYRNGEIDLARAYGVTKEDGRPLTPRTPFNLGSLSKPFTTLAALVLEQRGKLTIDEDVRRWVPELPDYGTPIRVRDLLQHTTGLRDFQSLEVLSGRPVTTMPEFLGLMGAQQALNFTPGTQHEYSHSDYGILGLVVERAAGMPFGEYLQREVLEPLGMKGSFVGRFPGSQTFGGDSLYASVEDLAGWDRNLATPVVGGPAAIARMLGRPTLPTGETIPYAYGIRLGTHRGLRTISRGGHAPGWQAEFVRFPDHELSVATLCNSDHLYASRFALDVAALYLGALMSPGQPRPTPPATVVLSPTELARHAGIYRPMDDSWNLLPIEVRNGVLGEVLFDDARDETFYPMAPAGAGRFFEVGTTGNVGIFAFRSAAPGAPPQLEISWNDGPIERLERVPDADVWRPSAAALAEYVGAWFSQDLDASWQLEVRAAALVLRRQGQPDVTLRPVARDRFLRGFGPDGELSVRLQFHRDRDRRLTHLAVSTPPGEDSVRDLRFVRRAKQSVGG